MLDVAVGSGSVEMAKYLLEFHGAKVTRETLLQSISAGDLELFKMTRGYFSEEELRDRIDLMEIAAEFHQEEVFVWLFRGATTLERELSTVFALEQKLADTLVIMNDNGHRPWWYRTREESLKWRGSADLDFGSAPDGFSVEGGWWRSASGGESALPPLTSEGGRVWTLLRSIDRNELMYTALPAGVTRIYDLAFRGCSGLARLDVPSSVTVIGRSAFENCSGLLQLKIPPSVETIEERAFEGCSGLIQLEMATGVTCIGERAFLYCSGLTRLRIPSSVTTVGSEAFSRCSGLTVLELPPSMAMIGPFAFCECRNLTEAKIPSGVTTIEMSAFQGCSRLNQVHIPSSVTVIGAFAFYNCSGLTRLQIPASVMVIGQYAFANCSGFSQLELPSSVVTIGKYAFCGCSGLTHLEVPSNLSQLGEGVFTGVTKLERLTLVGSVLSPAVVAALRGGLTLTAKVVGADLAARRFGPFRFGGGRFGRFVIEDG
jgi:hypothetical protein